MAPSRRVYFEATGWVDAKVHRFETLPAGEDVVGPAIVESSFTSVVVDPGARARRDEGGTLVIAVR
jgi:N-methylhydantoinase A